MNNTYTKITASKEEQDLIKRIEALADKKVIEEMSAGVFKRIEEIEDKAVRSATFYIFFNQLTEIVLGDLPEITAAA